MAFLARRAVFLVLTVLGMSLVMFAITHLIPADPARIAAGEYASREMVAHVRRELGLDESLPTQYVLYLRRLVGGDLGLSVETRKPVLKELSEHFPATVELSFFSLCVSLVVAVPLGVCGAIRRGSVGDHGSRIASLAGMSLPIFWLGLMLQLLFYKGLGWFPHGGRLSAGVAAPSAWTGLYTVDSLLMGDLRVFGDACWHLVLPGFSMSSITIAMLSRMTRTSTLAVLRQEYVRVARAKGLSELNIVGRHVLRNAAIPVVAVLGVQFGVLLTGAVLTETIFGWPGIGRLAFRAIDALDYPVIMGFALLVTLCFSLINVLTDVCYGLLDPRVTTR